MSKRLFYWVKEGEKYIPFMNVARGSAAVPGGATRVLPDCHEGVLIWQKEPLLSHDRTWTGQRTETEKRIETVTEPSHSHQLEQEDQS